MSFLSFGKVGVFGIVKVGSEGILVGEVVRGSHLGEGLVVFPEEVGVAG